MTVILIRHGRSVANTSGILAGRSPGVDLDDLGRQQATDLVDRLAAGAIAAVVRSPLDRCAQTVAPLVAQSGAVEIIDQRLIEVDYGEWTGRTIGSLFQEPLWRVVQAQPSAAVFPGGEGLAQVQARAVSAIRERDAALTDEFGPGTLWVACSHGDVIKSVIADAFGAHLDTFQRIMVGPASASIVSYTSSRPYVHCVNHSSGVLALPAPSAPAAAATIGGDRGV